MKILKNLGFGFVIIALVFAILCVCDASSNPFLNKNNIEHTTAKVVENEKQGYSSMMISINHEIFLQKPGKSQLQFTTTDGEEITADFPYYFAYVPSDEQAYIIYLKNDPQTMTLDTFWFYGLSVFIKGMVAVGALWISIGLFVINAVLKNKEEKNNQREIKNENYDRGDGE
jgi:outer membrane lipoprotein-sorting protein